jgi:2-methylisocitrate lyase-like PEP mutase family enzyme
MSNKELAEQLRALHIPGTPVILYNVWDAGSAQAVAASGAKAIATGGHGVANSFGYEDGENIPLELVLANAARITASINLPFTMDIDTGYGETPEAVQQTISKVIEAGVAGINIEDKLVGTNELRSTAEQVERLAAVRAAADEAEVPIVINARTDLFSLTDSSEHNEELVTKAVERSKAYKEAGGDSFFAPLLSDINLIKSLCEQSPLPINIIRLPGMVSNEELAAAGVARISYGPFPYLEMIEWLKDKAKAVYFS